MKNLEVDIDATLSDTPERSDELYADLKKVFTPAELNAGLKAAEGALIYSPKDPNLIKFKEKLRIALYRDK